MVISRAFAGTTLPWRSAALPWRVFGCSSFPVDPVDEIPRRFSTPRVFLDWLDEQVEKAAEKIEASRARRPCASGVWR